MVDSVPIIDGPAARNASSFGALLSFPTRTESLYGLGESISQIFVKTTVMKAASILASLDIALPVTDTAHAQSGSAAGM